MKKLLVLFLTLILLTGCASQPAPADTLPAAPERETEPLPTLYQFGSKAEKQSDGAVLTYALPDTVYTGLYPLGQDLLVATADGTLTLLRGQEGKVVATATADLQEGWTPEDLQIRKNGVIYFAQESTEVVLLDGHLQQAARIPLPEDISGKPLLSQSAEEIFFCIGTEIRALNIQTGTTRLVRQHNCVSQELTGSFFDDTIIGCKLTVESGATQIAYLYADTGEVIIWDDSCMKLHTFQQDYLAISTGAGNYPCLFGNINTDVTVLDVSPENLVPIMVLNGVVAHSATTDALTLRYYDLPSGKCSAVVSIPTDAALSAITCDGYYIWLTADNMLYRWDISLSPAADEALYTHPRYTAENPDTEGLAACQERADQLGSDYGLSIHLWQQAADLTPDYTAKAEHRTDVLQDSLDRLEALLQLLPKDFVSITGGLSIYLVGDLVGNQNCAQFWSSGDSHVVMDCSDVEKSFLIGLGASVDSKVLGNSRDFDTWSSLNPAGFEYTYSYNITPENPTDFANAFIDQPSMSFPTEDRSRIFAHAILPGNEAYFQQEVLQSKLLRLCQGIREAYGWDEHPEAFPWEQYLTDAIASDAS